jgi:peptide/nickel transport system substrate-binding protein
MAEGYTLSSDKRIYTITLRDGQKFHDQTPVRSADCIASIKRWAARDAIGQKLATMVDDYRALNDRRFEIRLKEPFRTHAVRAGQARQQRLLHHAGADCEHGPEHADQA